jgi:hypothetical protein
MRNIRDQKLLYHLTKIDNFESILRRGLLPRAQLQNFADVADPDIIASRQAHGLENYVPFHWFAHNPFDGRVQIDHPRTDFVLITVHRTLAADENWTVIPRHPLANREPELLSYADGIATIDWEMMNRRDYRDAQCRSVCMAECLSPRTVLPADFFCFYVKSERVAAEVRKQLKASHLDRDVIVNAGMFAR